VAAAQNSRRRNPPPVRPFLTSRSRPFGLGTPPTRECSRRARTQPQQSRVEGRGQVRTVRSVVISKRVQATATGQNDTGRMIDRMDRDMDSDRRIDWDRRTVGCRVSPNKHQRHDAERVQCVQTGWTELSNGKRSSISSAESAHRNKLALVDRRKHCSRSMCHEILRLSTVG
jgi:hypothetical protein